MRMLFANEVMKDEVGCVSCELEWCVEWEEKKRERVRGGKGG